MIVGPTASGKSKYAVALAQEISAEIVSADSMQIYRHMDIGTAKATPAERGGIPHHMIDIADPDERFSVADYQKMALACLDGIIARGRRAIIAGGAGLYISALVYNIRYPEFSADPLYRGHLKRVAQIYGNDWLHAELMKVDPISANKIHTNDEKRIIRALEVYNATGMPLSEHERLSRSEPPKFRFNLIGLDVARDELYRRIDLRVDRMLEMGLVSETRRLLERYGREGTALQAIGYKELIAYIDGVCSLHEAVMSIKTGTRRYAKRQMTWFRPMPGVKWVRQSRTDTRGARDETIYLR